MVSADHDTASDVGSLPERLEPGASVLLLSSSMDARAERTCLGMLPDPAETALLGVSLSGGVDAALDPWRQFSTDLPSKTAVVAVDETTRSAAAADGDGDTVSLPGRQVAVTTVGEPGDLTGLGIKTSQCLESWGDIDEQPVVRFDSLTTLLQYADVRRAFQFLHVLVRRIEEAGACGVFHMDPNAHDDQTLMTLRSLFDATHRLGPDGTWSAEDG